MADFQNRDPHVRDYLQQRIPHRAQTEYVVTYNHNPTLEEMIDIGIRLTLAIYYKRPLYFVVHHSVSLPDKFRLLATAVELYGHDGDDENTALARLLHRIERDQERSL